MPDIGATVSRHQSRAGEPRAAPLRGFLSSLPLVGAPMILYAVEADGGVARLITSLVQRVLSDGDRTLFVETRQSVYRVVLDEAHVELPRPNRLQVSFDGYELTVAPDAPRDDDAEDLESND
jgi:hypothetical protein